MQVWQILTTIASLVTILITIGGAVYIAGGQKALVATLVEKVAGNTTKIDAHEARLNGHEIQLALIDQWKAGFTSGALGHIGPRAPRAQEKKP